MVVNVVVVVVVVVHHNLKWLQNIKKKNIHYALLVCNIDIIEIFC